MALPLLNLDQRTFDELVSESRDLLPRYAPDWTDYNYHDPGITLVDLFAWLVEMDFYRLDRIPPASYRAFLRLIGHAPRPAQMADTVLVLGMADPSPVPLPAGTQVQNADGSIVFQTVEDLDILPAQLVAVVVGLDPHLEDHSLDNSPTGRPFTAFGAEASVGSALYLGFDQPLEGSGKTVSLYVWTGQPEADRQTKARLMAENKALKDDMKACPPGMAEPPDWWRHYSVRTVWEYTSQSGQWTALDKVVDETRACSLTGAVRFDALPDGEHATGDVPGAKAGLYWIRCRWVCGRFECPPQISCVAVNTVLARHAVDLAQPEALDASTGRAMQARALRRRPVVPGSTHLSVTLPSGTLDDEWHEALVWDQVRPHDRAYVLDPETGVITFGDDRVGRVPPASATFSIQFQVGGGPTGNVSAGTLTAFSATPPANVTLQQPYAALGGAAAETLDDARARALDWLDEAHRAVTLADLENLALRTPGLPVARAVALPDYYPPLPCIPAAGCVTVVIIPRCPRPEPAPGPDMLAAVQRYLDRRRTVATELHVIGPEYTTVGVNARLVVARRTDTRSLVAQARQAIDRFLDPLHGGPQGTGWPMGRPVYRAEILALLNSLPGVQYVDNLTLSVDNQADGVCDNVALCPHGLVAPGAHKITTSER